MNYSKDELAEAGRQIDSVLHKLSAVLQSLEGKAGPSRYKSQITLTRRRIRAFEIALSLIGRELDELT